jgi:hypothetical protein
MGSRDPETSGTPGLGAANAAIETETRRILTFECR